MTVEANVERYVKNTIDKLPIYDFRRDIVILGHYSKNGKTYYKYKDLHNQIKITDSRNLLGEDSLFRYWNEIAILNKVASTDEKHSKNIPQQNKEPLSMNCGPLVKGFPESQNYVFLDNQEQEINLNLQTMNSSHKAALLELLTNTLHRSYDSS
ncbi:hypothetical protein TVAG_078070 [Trichomonas vaginalis G3]|uniref:Uncharacterized protein n=1 Tax=Trichomonas vaginalis (strain ATCC PRA-98 / G3) TaxID=412133 RepID=A2FIB0_TRIV3|nr:hypothetical protein TVAGG3_0558460 [Trichomonas vaginalis G3]EAX95351.1 hypothetical protein TVAG_078070 [Trichomonas vaginalis G3]KAI5521012.1 hypothetical protein TVAGG3_0558460 [Trichomonas vaginalis G3]|eukprot:XP_001308281.1 hypothetical protein [Trichomonas vaginalis G3]